MKRSECELWTHGRNVKTLGSELVHRGRLLARVDVNEMSRCDLGKKVAARYVPV